MPDSPPGRAAGNVPDRARARFPGISSRAYEHPADRTALVALRRLQGFDVVLKKLVSFFDERRLRLTFLGSAVRVDDRQLRHLHDIVRDAAHVLDLPEVPELYVVNDPVPHAMALGVDRPWIVVSTGMLDLLDDEEQRFVVGHEVGHVLSGHAVYRTMLFILMELSAALAWTLVGSWGINAIVQALKEWFRKSELSCDRAGLLVGQDLSAALRTHMKLAGGTRWREMDVDAFLAQADEYDAAKDLRDGVLKMLNTLRSTHPFAAVRAAELRRWARGGDYERILAGDYPRRADDPSTSWRDEVRSAAASYRDTVGQSADPFLKLVKDIGEAAGEVGRSVFERWGRRD